MQPHKQQNPAQIIKNINHGVSVADLAFDTLEITTAAVGDIVGEAEYT